ncbi:NAD-dependent epimerase/dehydratase family protein [Thiothrix nivea]|uniref:NAD-dependent epimerase/dehydratase n=1 Tax=Thiothrix nivea (strain ATCC 35100 / DSM 5205 / JP2) TaxID=870187 RepID=A0A656HMW2_THINJ|nr:NAD-dependent epimerase/dehydratase family protein [Thiothrix nivea]EIJ36866.1 NAD-dependent epimerase/dehydratase [Thiothrix nivea DSM 5205]
MSLVLLTGGAGFIGFHLTATLLKAGYTVRILDNLAPQIHGALPTGLDWLSDQRVEFMRGSVTHEQDVHAALAGVDTVIHLAAETGTGQSMYEIARYNAVNVGGTALLLDVLANDAGRSVKRIILASSRSIYGEGAYVCPSCSPDKRVYPDGRSMDQLAAHRWEHECATCGANLMPVPTKETDPAKPASIYAATKYAQEDLVRVACASLGMDYAILRLQNVYGEGQSLKNPYTGILSIFSTRIRCGQHLPIFEDGLETRDFVHVEDVANAFLAAVQMSGSINQVINVGAGSKTSVTEIAGHLSDALDGERNLQVTAEYRLGDIRHNYADITRLQTVLGYVPQVGLAEGVQRFADWARQQPLPQDLLDKANAELRARKLMG